MAIQILSAIHNSIAGKETLIIELAWPQFNYAIKNK